MTTNKKSTKINLIETWIDAAKNYVPGYAVRDALADLNEALGKNYNTNQLGKWRRGDEAVPQQVQDYMLKDVIYHVLLNNDIVMSPDDARLDSIAAALIPPVRR
jgi:hypothetical protein